MCCLYFVLKILCVFTIPAFAVWPCVSISCFQSITCATLARKKRAKIVAKHVLSIERTSNFISPYYSWVGVLVSVEQRAKRRTGFPAFCPREKWGTFPPPSRVIFCALPIFRAAVTRSLRSPISMDFWVFLSLKDLKRTGMIATQPGFAQATSFLRFL